MRTRLEKLTQRILERPLFHVLDAAHEGTLSRRDAGLDEYVDREAAFLAELQDG